MANLLDEVTGVVNENGRDIHVIDRQIPVQIGFGSVLFEIALWVVIQHLCWCMSSLWETPLKALNWWQV